MIPPNRPGQDPIKHPIPQKRTRDESQSPAAAASAPAKQTRKTKEVADRTFSPIHKFPTSPELYKTKFRQDGSFCIGPTPPPESPERNILMRPRPIRGRTVINETPPNVQVVQAPAFANVNFARSPSPPYDPFNPLPDEEYVSATDEEHVSATDSEEIDHVSASDEEL